MLKLDDPVNDIIFVERGTLEVISNFEGTDVVLDRLYSGAVIN